MNLEEFLIFAKQAYNPQKNTFTQILIPTMRYLWIEGKGNPDEVDFPSMIKWLYSVVHEAKPFTKKIMGKHFGYPPVEFQFWAKNSKDFVNGNKSKWFWRVMVVCADFMPSSVMHDAIASVNAKLGSALGKVKLDYITEGKCVQYLHLGDYDGVAKVCEQLYGQYVPDNQLTPNGYYHEIYLNDPTRAAPKKRKIIIRQPIL